MSSWSSATQPDSLRFVPVNANSAMEIAGRFFGYLAAGHTAGNALVRVRRFLLSSYWNPVALTYLCYGFSDLQVTPEI